MYIQLERNAELLNSSGRIIHLNKKKKKPALNTKKKQIKVTPETKQTDTYLLNYQEEAIQ